MSTRITFTVAPAPAADSAKNTTAGAGSLPTTYGNDRKSTHGID